MWEKTYVLDNIDYRFYNIESKLKRIISGGSTQKVDCIICLLALVSFYGGMHQNPQWNARNVIFMFIGKEHRLKKKKKKIA